MTPNTEVASVGEMSRKKPRLAFAIATVTGIGYLPKAPGTFGSLAGLVLAVSVQPEIIAILLPYGSGKDAPLFSGTPFGPLAVMLPSLAVLLLVALFGVWSAGQVAKYADKKDPRYVVVDEVSGQHLTFIMGLGFATFTCKGLLLGFLLFRLFDIWKPYPIRWLEKLPGGWGIMADDWLAGVYAAIVLRVAVQLLHL